MAIEGEGEDEYEVLGSSSQQEDSVVETFVRRDGAKNCEEWQIKRTNKIC